MSNKPNPNRPGAKQASRPGARRLVVADWEAKRRDEGTIIIDLGDAGEIEVEPPLFWGRRLPTDPKERAKLSVEDTHRLVLGDAAVDLWLSSVDPETGEQRTTSELEAVFAEAHGMAMGKSSASSKS